MFLSVYLSVLVITLKYLDHVVRFKKILNFKDPILMTLDPPRLQWRFYSLPM